MADEDGGARGTNQGRRRAGEKGGYLRGGGDELGIHRGTDPVGQAGVC